MPERAFGWRDVLAALPDDDARSYALSQYRALGFSPDDFEHGRVARAAMADSLSRVEDWLELERPRRDRQAIRRVRRSLEAEVR